MCVLGWRQSITGRRLRRSGHSHFLPRSSPMILVWLNHNRLNNRHNGIVKNVLAALAGHFSNTLFPRTSSSWLGVQFPSQAVFFNGGQIETTRDAVLRCALTMQSYHPQTALSLFVLIFSHFGGSVRCSSV